MSPQETLKWQLMCLTSSPLMLHWSSELIQDSFLSEESKGLHNCSVTVILSQGHCLSCDPLVNIQHPALGHSQGAAHQCEPWIIWSHWAHTHDSIYTRCVWWHVWDRLRLMPQESHINKCQLRWVGLRADLMQCLNRGPQHQPSAHIKALECWELSLDCDRQEVVILSPSNAEQRWRSSRQKTFEGQNHLPLHNQQLCLDPSNYFQLRLIRLWYEKRWNNH